MKKEEKTDAAFGHGFNVTIGILQRRIADWLNRHCKKLSAHMLIAIFILFCMMAGLYCMYLIFGILN
jgi:sensor histidine kinase regulating citrate/malate metabolism